MGLQAGGRLMSERSLGALRAVELFRRGLDELKQLDRTRPDESGPLFDLLAQFVSDWRATRTN